MRTDDNRLIHDAAIEAGAMALQYWKNDTKAWDKPAGGGPVSEADIAVDRFLIERLRTSRPSYGWLSEETPDTPERLTQDFTFIVDPIDGTRAFLAGRPEFGIAIAVAHLGEVVAAVVNMPALDLVYTASRGNPSRCNGRPIRCRDTVLADALILTPSSSMSQKYWRGSPPKFARDLQPSLAWRICLVGEGPANGALSFSAAWEWDIAAASLIAGQAGAVVSDRFGLPMQFNSPQARQNGIWIAGPRLHDELGRRMLRPSSTR